jgi:broad specificity phosphatase PhoE
VSRSQRDCTRVYLVRHGETDWNRDQRLQGTSDVSLNARGFGQAQELADHLSRLTIACVITSPLVRAAATAATLADRCRCPLVIDTRLREVDHGSWTARTLPDIARESPRLVTGGQLEPAAFDVSGGETLRDVFLRVSSALADIVARHDGQSVVVVSHGVALAIIECAAAGAAPSDYRDHLRPNATIAKLTFGQTRAHLPQVELELSR